MTGPGEVQGHRRRGRVFLKSRLVLQKVPPPMCWVEADSNCGERLFCNRALRRRPGFCARAAKESKRSTARASHAMSS